MQDKARRVEQDAIDPPFERSLELLPRLAKGKVIDAMTWLHTDPEAEAKRREAKEARDRERALRQTETPKDEQ